MQALGWDSGTGAFLWILRHFYVQLFHRTTLVAASDNLAAGKKSYATEKVFFKNPID